MAEVKIKTSLTADRLKGLLSVGPRELNDAGRLTRDKIRSFARIGKRMKNERPGTQLLPNLSNTYVEARKRNNFTDTDPNFFRPGSRRSNYTFTGETLKEGLNFRINRRGQSFRVFFSGRHPNGETYSNIAGFLVKREERYDILTVNNATIRQIRQLYTRTIRKKLRKR